MNVTMEIDTKASEVVVPSYSELEYLHRPLEPPKETPREFAVELLQYQQHQQEESEPRFDPSIHLQLESPTVVRTLSFQDVPFPYNTNKNDTTNNVLVPCSKAKTHAPNFAYTPIPFRILSDQGIQALRSIVETYKPQFLKQNERNNSLRGLGYLSSFVREFTYCPSIMEFVSDMAQESLYPHDGIMNHGHTNVGMMGQGKAVDQWHVDSVDYVCILILSDTTHMKGGDVQILHMVDATGSTFDTLQQHGIPDDMVQSVPVPPAGYGLFMRGSKLLHSVSPVLAGGMEARHSMILPWTTRNVFAQDLTRLDPFREQFGDPKNVADLEYARHKAWRISGQMQYIMDDIPFGTPTELVAEILKRAADELERASQLLLGEISDIPGFLVHKEDTVTSDGRDRTDCSISLVTLDNSSEELSVMEGLEATTE